MKRQHIAHVIKDSYEVLNSDLEKLSKNFDVEAIHQFRIAYKKLRAFLRMISYHYQAAHAIQMSKELRHCYHLAGDLRNLQLQRLRVKMAVRSGLEKPHQYLHLIGRQMKTLERALRRIILTRPVAASKERTMVALPVNFNKERCREFFVQKWSDVFQAALSQQYTDENLHTIRKDLKDLFYSQELSKGAKRRIVKTPSCEQRDMLYFPTLMDAIGDLQDLRMGIALINTPVLKMLDANELPLLKEAKRKWLRDKSGMKRHIADYLQLA